MIIMVDKNYNVISQSELNKLFSITNVQYVFAAHSAPHKALVVSNRSGDYQLYTVDFKIGREKQITYKEGGVLFGSISPSGRYVYILSGYDGGEHGHFVCIPFDGGEAVDITPRIDPYFSFSLSSDYKDETLCFTASVNGSNTVFVVKDNEESFAVHRIYSSPHSLSEPVCAPDGRYVCVAEAGLGDKKEGGSVLVFIPANGDGGKRVVRSRLFESVTPLAFSHTAQSPTLLALARMGEHLRPIVYDIKQQRILDIQHSMFRGDVWVLRWDEDKDEMLVCDVCHAEQMLYLYNTRTKELQRVGPKTGSFNIHFNSAVRLTDDSFIVRWSDFNTSPRLIRLFPPSYDTWEEVVGWSEGFKTSHRVKSVQVHSSDGTPVQAWVVRPSHAKGPIPFVIDVHGGPHGIVGDEFSPEAQAWLAAGFGYCAVNYRGSIGFGREFERKIYGNPGYWEVEDVVAVRNWLVQNSYADIQDIILYGWSWGGYVVLLALGKYPTLWRCGIAGAAIADCVMQYEDEPAYFKAQDQELFQGTPQTARAQYIRSSPTSYAERIQVPILLLHGENDVRCPPRQIKYFADILKKTGKDVSVIWFKTGHVGDFTDTSLRRHLMEKALNFVMSCKNDPSRTIS